MTLATNLITLLVHHGRVIIMMWGNDVDSTLKMIYH